MPLTKDQKKQILEKIVTQMKGAKSVAFANYQGMTVKEIDNLRDKMAEQGVKYQVAKKTLIRLAAKELGYPEIPDAVMDGMISVAFSMEDELAAAKLIYMAGKKSKNLRLMGALFEGKVLDMKAAMQLATLPSREELLAKFLYVIKSPIQGFHSVLYNTMSNFVRVLSKISEKQSA